MIRTIVSSTVKNNICESCIHFIPKDPTKNIIVKTIGQCDKLSIFIDKNDTTKQNCVFFHHYFDVYPF